jgi:hypothetical protein
MLYRLVLVLSALIVALLPGVLHADDDSLVGPRHTSYTLDWDKRRLPGPQSYELEWEIEGPRLAPGGLKDPADLFLDRAGYLYIADRGDDRVVRLTSEGVFVDIIGPAAPDGLSQPEGVFVADDGEIYVADTGHSRIAVFNPNGSFRYSIGAPHSNLLEEGPYKPSKLIVDRRGYIYVIESGGDYRGILLLDHQGTFRGFFAANPVGFSLQRWFARIFATKEQKKQLSKVRPTHHANMVLDDRGFVYTVLPFASSDQIKKLSQIGTNVYPSGKYGEVEREPSGAVQQPRFIDIAVDEQGIISALDFNSGKIYQYDQNGNFLTVFGGKAWRRGYFGYPASLVAGPGGVLYVLDAERASVDRFRPTEFTRLVHQASALYFDGKYEEAAEIWRQVLKLDTNYILAHQGLAKAYLKQEQWREAMQEYFYAHDRAGYSQAFAEWRHQFAREHFGLVMFGTGAVILLLWGFFRVLGWLLAQANRLERQLTGYQ